MSPLPPEFWGVWDRLSLVVDGREIPDAGEAHWFQSSSGFLDVRTAGGGLPAEAFGGETTWSASDSMLRWSHVLDLHPGPSDDAGRIEWVDGDLVEHGSVHTGDRNIVYAEVWRRVSDGAPVVIADHVEGAGRVAWCGMRGAVLLDQRPAGAFQAGSWHRQGEDATFEFAHGPALNLEPTALALAVAARRNFELFGHDWVVVG